jgi:hypothetical protein
MNDLVKSKKRQQIHGEVFTADFTVDRMLCMVPEDIWNDPSKTFLEPSCGNGNFIVAIIRKKIAHGSTIEQALSTTFGVDILEDNIIECRKRVIDEFTHGDQSLIDIVNHNIKCGNFLE